MVRLKSKSNHPLKDVVEGLINDGRKLERTSSIDNMFVWSESPEGYAFWKWADSEFEVMTEDEAKLAEEIETLKWSLRFNADLVELYEAEIGVLANALSEKRSDISEILYNLLNGHRVNPTDIEHRYVRATVPSAGEVLYDTLTTTIEFRANEGHFSELEVQYED